MFSKLDHPMKASSPSPSLRLAGSLVTRNENVRGAATGFRPRTSEADRLLLLLVAVVVVVLVVSITAAVPASPSSGLLAGSPAAEDNGISSCSLGVGDGDEEQEEERECGDGERSSRLLGLSGIFGLSLSRSGGLRVMTGLGVPFRIDPDIMWGPTT
jgi:hypothetical protein